MRRNFHIFLLFGVLLIGAAYGKSFLRPASFPKTFDDLSFEDRMDVLAEDFENYAELTPYQQIFLQEWEDVVQAEVDKINAQKCATEGVACDGETPVQDGTTYTPPAQQPVAQAPETPAQPAAPTNNTPTSGETQSHTNGVTASGYCSLRQPQIPKGQKVPLGSPVYFEDVRASHSDKRTDSILTNSKNGQFCSPYQCRGKPGGGSRPHQGIDIGCTADFFKVPIYSPADGVVTVVKHAGGNSSAGNYIRIKHSDGWETQYMHLESIFVTQGQQVEAGCAIAAMGYTGGNVDQKVRSMGIDLTHLHYEILYSGSASSFKTPNGKSIPIVRGGEHACGDFKTKIRPNDFVSYYYKNK